jgi:N6-adenosine-specific RNA methylase IME4
MSIADICAMPIPDLALTDCALFLWGTWPKLPEALAALTSWGFEYVTGLPWVKMTKGRGINYGVGYWVRGCSEYVLIGRRGQVSPPRIEGYLGILSPNLGHSRKPDSIHEIAEALPGPYLELFARRSRSGWDVFGDDIAAQRIEAAQNEMVQPALV